MNYMHKCIKNHLIIFIAISYQPGSSKNSFSQTHQVPGDSRATATEKLKGMMFRLYYARYLEEVRRCQIQADSLKDTSWPKEAVGDDVDIQVPVHQVPVGRLPIQHKHPKKKTKIIFAPFAEKGEVVPGRFVIGDSKACY